MDRVGFGIKLEQICRLRDKGEYIEAAKIADTIEWRKVKKWSELSVALEVYDNANRLKDARNICVYAYNRNLGGKRLLYKLTELSIAINDLDEADELYKEYADEAPKDSARYILLYRLNVARGASAERLIEILEEYKNNELEEKYEYELADLYARVGRIEDCVRECDDLILWFNEGEYVEKALELKKRFAPLTRSQQAKYDYFQEARRAGIDPHVEEEPEYIPEQDSGITKEVFTMDYTPYTEAPVKEEKVEPAVSVEPKVSSIPEEEEEILVPEKNYEIYDTQNIQAELAKSMSIIMESMARSERPEDNVFRADIKKEEMTVSIIEPLEGTGGYEEPEEVSETTAEVNIVDEPTKEIRINTHHWNKAVVTPQPVAPAPAAVVVPVAPATEVQETIEGQIGLLDWLNSAVDNATQEVAKEEAAEAIAAAKTEAAATVVEPEKEEDPVVAPAEEPKMDTVELAINELNRQLMEEEAQAAKNKEQVKPVEEYVDIEDEQVEEYTEEIVLEEEPETEPEEEPEAEVEPETEPEAEKEESVEEETTEPEEEPVMAPVEASVETPVEEVIEDTAEEVVEAEVEEEPMPLVASKVDPKLQYTSVMKLPVIENTMELNDILAKGPIEPKVSYNTMELIAPLTPEERKYVRKYLCMEGMEHAINTLIKCKKLDRPDGTSSKGNILITGRADLDKTGFAINLFKAMHANDDIRQLEIAKTTATIINKKGVAASADKIKGTTLIIENAGMLVTEAVKELTEFMKGDTGSMLVILTGEDYSMKKLFMDDPEFAALFTHTIELKKMSVNDLVIIAKEYARDKGYSIDEKALLKVYLLIDEMQSKNPEEETEGVKRIVDKAIEKCGNRGKGLFGRKSGTLIPLKEKHF